MTALDIHCMPGGYAGEVTADDQYFVQMTTSFGGGRIVDWLAGEQLPRIC